MGKQRVDLIYEFINITIISHKLLAKIWNYKKISNFPTIQMLSCQNNFLKLNRANNQE